MNDRSSLEGNSNSTKTLQSIVDHEKVIMIKLTPLPYTTTIESIKSWILTLTDSPYNLPQPRFIDMTKDFNQALLVYNNINDQLISDLYDSMIKLNQVQINPLEQERLISVGLTHHPHSVKQLEPIRFKFISSGYLETSILGIYSSSDLLSRDEDQEKMELNQKSKHQLSLIESNSNSNSTLKRKSDWNSILIKQKKLQLEETKAKISKEELKKDAINLINQRSNRIPYHQKLINSILERKQSNQPSGSNGSASGSG
ncbi:hypothetical protein DFH28DRAFT_1032897 [Melampsora americana]|nr:hypothetical protein DFH28DRAFT_1032897 [Melampsora americana]